MAKRIPDSARPSKETYEELYVRQALSVRQLAKRFGFSAKFIRDELARVGVERRPPGRHKWAAVEARTEQAYKALYIEKGMSVREVARELGVCPDVVVKDMERFGLDRRPVSPTTDELARREALGLLEDPGAPVVYEIGCSGERRDALDVRFFENIDTDTKAYALGLIWTDGTIDLKRGVMRITLQQQDERMLERLRVAMGALPLSILPPQRGGKAKSPTATLRVCSASILGQLQKLGLCESKSERLPKVVAPPAGLLRAFVRGAMDGDGSLYRPEYPTIVFYNQNPFLRDLVIECWQAITGKRPPTYAPITEGIPRGRVCEIGQRAVAIAQALYLDRSETIAIDRKRERAQQFQSWRKQSA